MADVLRWGEEQKLGICGAMLSYLQRLPDRRKLTRALFLLRCCFEGYGAFQQTQQISFVQSMPARLFNKIAFDRILPFLRIEKTPTPLGSSTRRV